MKIIPDNWKFDLLGKTKELVKEKGKNDAVDELFISVLAMIGNALEQYEVPDNLTSEHTEIKNELVQSIRSHIWTEIFNHTL